MSDHDNKIKSNSRRDFIKFTGFTAAGVTLGKYLRDYALRYELFNPQWADRGPGIESRKLSVCRQCPAGCGLRVRLVDGDVKKLDGNPLCPVARGTLCPKGQAGVQSLYNPDRLVGPVRRSGPRGSGQWERIGWDEAMQEVQSKLDSLRTEGNPQSVAWIAERNDATQGRLIRRFMRAYGSPNLFEFVDMRDESARLSMNASQGVDEFPAYDMRNVNFIISFGTPVLESWLSPTWMNRQYGRLRRGRPDRRGRLVQIESRMSPTAIAADEWIPIEPGTEAALALAIAHVMIREGLYDRTFVEEHTVGFDGDDGFRSTVLREYSPGDVSARTGISVTIIFRLARELAAQKPALVIGEHTPLSGGISLASAVHALNALNGMIDNEGGLLTQRPLPLKPLPDLVPDETARQGLTQPLIELPTVLPRVADAITESNPYPLQALFISSSRFFNVAPEAEKFYASTAKIPFIVSFSSVLDDSAAFADLILPDHSPLEKWQDAAPLPVNGRPVWAVSAPAIEPLLDTRHTGEVVMELGRNLGAFPWKDITEVLRFEAEGLFEARRGTPYTTPYESAWISQLETGGWWIPSARTFSEFWRQLLDNGGWFDPVYHYERWPRVLRTTSGKFEFRPVQQFEPVKWVGSERDYPFKLKVFTVLTTAGLENPNQPFLRETLAPQVYARWKNWVELNPNTAKQLGVADKDWVWLESPLGKLRMRILTFAGAMPDVVSVMIGHEHREGGEFVIKNEGTVADLVAYRNDATNTIPLAATTRVKVYKA
jgi:menaquinone reductase, molybdopterin-binding-like subunit